MTGKRESGGLPQRLVFVGSGGVGKTTLAAALGVQRANEGERALVMTFDPSLRLKDALGLGDEARDIESQVDLPGDRGGSLFAHLLDARRTFDQQIERYSENEEVRDRILGNRFYRNLAGELAGILEYMAVERLYEAVESDRYDRIILDTPPTREALDFLDAPKRIISFLDSGAVRVALKPWFDDEGRLRPAELPGVGRPIEALLDRMVGIDLLRDMAEFFRAFAPLFAGFRERAEVVGDLLRSPETGFVLVAAPAERSVADAMFFARSLTERGHRLVAVVANRAHPRADPSARPTARPRGGDEMGLADPAGTGLADPAGTGLELMAWLGERDQRGIDELRSLLAGGPAVASLPLLEESPSSIGELGQLGADLEAELGFGP